MFPILFQMLFFIVLHQTCTNSEMSFWLALSFIHMSYRDFSPSSQFPVVKSMSNSYGPCVHCRWRMKWWRTCTHPGRNITRPQCTTSPHSTCCSTRRRSRCWSRCWDTCRRRCSCSTSTSAIGIIFHPEHQLIM